MPRKFKLIEPADPEQDQSQTARAFRDIDARLAAPLPGLPEPGQVVTVPFGRLLEYLSLHGQEVTGCTDRLIGRQTIPANMLGSVRLPSKFEHFDPTWIMTLKAKP